MKIIIDLVIDLKKNSSHSYISNLIKEKANNNYCISISEYYESEGTNHTILVNNLIIQLTFYENKSKMIQNFIKFIIKSKLAKIESIYKDDGIIEFFYMSKKYKLNNNFQNNNVNIKFKSLNNYLNFLGSSC